MTTIALTDQVSWDTDNAFALEQTEEMKADRIMNIYKLKLRRGFYEEGKKPIRVMWDFDEMEFGEVRGRRKDSRDDTFKDEGWDDDIPFDE